MTNPMDDLSIAELGASGLSPQALALYLLAYAQRSGAEVAEVAAAVAQSSASMARPVPTPADSTFYAYA
jgi:hypothetical protein